MRISDWSSDVCSSDLLPQLLEWPAKTSSDSLRSCFRGSAHVRQTSKQWRSTPSRQARICTGVSPAQSPLSVRLSKRHVFEERLQRGAGGRSEEHTSELQSLMRLSSAAVCLKKTNT